MQDSRAKTSASPERSGGHWFHSAASLGYSALLLFAGILPSSAQTTADPPAVPRPEAPAVEAPAIEAPSGDPGADVSLAPAAPETGEPVAIIPEPEPTPEEARARMLERIAANLSQRMRSLLDREKLAAERERALSEREVTLEERESLLEAREEVVRRREILPPPQSWRGPEAPRVVGQYAAVIDGRTMQFYYLKNAFDRTPVASTQKLMTAFIVCAESDLDEMIEIPKEVLRVQPTVIGVKPGQKYTRRDLVRALLVRSGNDIATTLAVDNAGSEEAFADKMNLYAVNLGMRNTNFITPHGLPAEGQYSCAHDIAILGFESYQIPAIREMVGMKRWTFHFEDGTPRELVNTNRVLTTREYCNGMKTGFTYASGHCLVSSGEVDGQERIAVVIKSHRPYVWSDSEKLLDWAFSLEVKPSGSSGFASR